MSERKTKRSWLSGVELRRARLARGWSQLEAAKQLGMSQSYVSMLETSQRRVSSHVVPNLLKTYDLPATALPVPERSEPLVGQKLARLLAGLGYPGFAYLRSRRRVNPVEVLLRSLRHEELEARLAEALPWVVLNYVGMNWDWLVARAKLYNLQNRLGFVVTLARELAERKRDPSKRAKLFHWEAVLEASRLAREDTFCHDSLSQAERRWLRQRRSPGARHWNLLSDLSAEHLARVA